MVEEEGGHIRHIRLSNLAHSHTLSVTGVDLDLTSINSV